MRYIEIHAEPSRSFSPAMKQEWRRLDNGLRSRLATIDAAKTCGKGVYAIRHGGAGPAPVPVGR